MCAKTFRYITTLFSRLLYFRILFGLPVTLAIHIIIRYRVHEKWICFWSKYSCLPSGIQTIFGRLLGYGWCEHLYLNEFFQIHFVFYAALFFLLLGVYVNNSDVVQVTILKNVFLCMGILHKNIEIVFLYGWENRVFFSVLSVKLVSTTIIHLQL